MMPSAGERSVNWRKYTGEEYVIWMAAVTETFIRHELFNAPKNTIDFTYESQLSEKKPTWVEAAEEVVSTVVDAVVGDEEAEEEVIEEEEIEVPFNNNPFSEIDYDSMTVKELQELCRERELTIRGTKAEVVLRLRRDDEGIVEQETEDEAEALSEESEAAEEELDAPSEESEAVTEEVTDNDNSGETSDINEEE